ncbi:9414_t:CDS:1 [Dentiscutata erythropus]|uniref:9414_t:CDS:1 n=1 Tax=Dentiscutata erythropus TaxID=1348616 RepID=A0A9N9INC0_9GLOM|nr:9414_t:CDS:1 [Dentiscutata erythropus]
MPCYSLNKSATETRGNIRNALRTITRTHINKITEQLHQRDFKPRVISKKLNGSKKNTMIEMLGS